jgi:hypothetical protein
MRDDNAKILRKLTIIQKKLGARDNDDDDNGRGTNGSTRWTENKLLMIFLILMALSMLVLAGAKLSEVAGIFKQANKAVSAISDGDDKANEKREK